MYKRIRQQYVTIDVNENHHCIQNFIENSPLKGVVYPSFFNSDIPQKGVCFECLGEQEESTPARVAISGFSGQIDGIYSYSTFRKDRPHLNTEDSAIEKELHSYLKKHFQKCPAVIENTSMKGKPQPGDDMDLSNLGEEEVRVCDICGDVGLEELLAICSKCTDGAEHIYCMRIKLDKVPEGDWTCEECILRTEAEKPAQDKVKDTTRKSIEHPQCQRFGSSVNIESTDSSKIKSRSSCAGGKGTNDVNSFSLLPAKRHGTLSQAQSVKKAKTTGVRAVLPRSSKPCSNSLLHRNMSFKNLKKELSETKETTSVLQLSCSTSEKAKVPIVHGDQRCVETLKAGSDRQTRDIETEDISPKRSNTNKSLLQRDTSFNLKGQMEAFKQTASDLQIYCNSQEKEEVPSASSDERYVASLKAELDKRKRDLQTKQSPEESKTINNPALHRDPSFKDLKKGKMKPSKKITSVLQISCNAQRKANVPSAGGDEKGRDIMKKVISSKASQPINHIMLRRDASFENLEKKKVFIAQNVSSLKKSSYGTEEKAHLSSILGDKSPKSCSQSEILQDECSLLKSISSDTADLKLKGQPPKGSLLNLRSSIVADLKLKGELTTGGSLQKLTFDNISFDKLNTPSSEVLLPNSDHSEVFKKLDHSKETQLVKGKSMSKLQNLVMGSTVAEPGFTTFKRKKESLPYDDAFLTDSKFSRKLDSVKCCGLFNNSLDPSNNITHKPASDEGSDQRNLPKPEATFASQDFVIPEPDYIWLGKFQLYSRDGLESSCDGIQAHLSTFASPKVLEAVDNLPEIIILEQLPRLKTWPSQFVERQASEENIALYFFATDLDSYRTHYSRLLECMTKNDLALRGNLDGVELLIFPSNLLPEGSQRWNSLLFLWGVFRRRKFGNSLPLSNSLEEKNRYSEKTLSLDLNAYPQEGEDTGGVDEGGKCWSVNNPHGEIHKFDSRGAMSSADGVFLGGDSYNSDLTGVMQENEKGEIKSAGVELDLSLWPKSDGVGGNRNNEEMREEPAMEDVKASPSGWDEQFVEAQKRIKELLLDWQAAYSLILLSMGFGRI